MAQMPQDPSGSIAADLLPHVHLLSTFRYPVAPRLDPQEVTKYLVAAPQIAKDRAPFFWTYLDKPTDGTVLLTWQPLARLGTNFASDGFIWAHPEQFHRQDMGNGLALEIYYHKAGYIPGEQFTVHSRRRFRLVPSAVANNSVPPPDVSLWIVHYLPAEPNDRIPVTMIPYDERTNQIVQTRMYLQKCGQIHRKDFMLSDRVNWPQIMFPRETSGRQQPPMYPGPPNQRGVPQQMAYPPHPPAGPPSKRARHAPAAPAQGPPPPQMAGVPHMDAAYDDEEDVSRGDMFDTYTPREIALARYQQNHEWMEEILSSPYRVGQITPADLGLGLMGQLSSITDGIFSAQGGDALQKMPEKQYIGRLDPKMADEFRKRIKDHCKGTEDEIAKMEAKHARDLAKLKANSLISNAEKDLRYDGADNGVREVTDSMEDQGSHWGKGHHKSVDKIVAEVEGFLGKKIETLHQVHRTQDGGYEEPAPEPIPEPVIEPPPAHEGPTAEASASMSRQPSHTGSQHSGVMIGDSDIDMGGTAAGLMDQMHSGFSATSTPINNFPTPQPALSAIPSAAATPANIGVPSPAPAPAQLSELAQVPGQDVAMGGTEPAKEASASSAPDQGTGSGDWVVVPKGGVSPEPQGTASAAAATSAEIGQSAVPTAGTPASLPPKPASLTSAAATPAVTDGGSAAFDQNDFSSLGDLDTAGDALAGYEGSGAGGDELGGDLDLHMDLEDSAFGDAFHGVGTPAEAQGDSI